MAATMRRKDRPKEVADETPSDLQGLTVAFEMDGVECVGEVAGFFAGRYLVKSGGRSFLLRLDSLALVEVSRP